MKIVQWVRVVVCGQTDSCCVRTDRQLLCADRQTVVACGQTERYEQANSHFSQFCVYT